MRGDGRVGVDGGDVLVGDPRDGLDALEERNPRHLGQSLCEDVLVARSAVAARSVAAAVVGGTAVLREASVRTSVRGWSRATRRSVEGRLRVAVRLIRVVHRINVVVVREVGKG
jgi:hypothetical protein